MPIYCVLPESAENLREAFKSGALSIEKLRNMKSSTERVEALRQYVGNTAEMTVAGLEKAFMVPDQKRAITNWAFKNIANAKPLYRGITLDQSAKMAEGISVRDLRTMSGLEREATFAKYVDRPTAEELNSKYERLQKSGNVAQWEERAFGTKKLRADKKLKGALSKLEALDDLGVLNPKQMEDFMQTFVESELGVDVTAEEGAKLSKFIDEQRAAYEKLVESGDWTADNKAQMVDYFEKIKKLEDFTDQLAPKTLSDIANAIVGLFRANILFSPRILKNSFLYQLIPGIERTIMKRLISGQMTEQDLKSNYFEKAFAKLSAIKPDADSMSFMKRQTGMAIEIYHKTGYDISRMQTLEDGRKFFGERFGTLRAKPFAEAEGIKEKGISILSKASGLLNLAPKWFAGGTDTLFANLGRADTALMLSKERASLEAQRGLLPAGMMEEQRAKQLLKESYSFEPLDPQAQLIREMAILDAHRMNSTQKDGYADRMREFRKIFRIGKIDFGTALIPFIKIASTVISEGVQTATMFGIAKNLWKINQSAKQPTLNDRAAKMQEGINDLARYLGLTGAALLLASMLDDDDYAPIWGNMSYGEYRLYQARGAQAGSVRIGGKWMPLRYLSIISIPVSAILTARQVHAQGGNPLFGFVAGTAAQLLEAPGIKEAKDVIFKGLMAASNSQQLSDMLDSMGVDGKSMMDWAKVRVMPSVLSYDIYNAVVPQDKRFDFLGREVDKANYLGFRNDKTNEILLEYDRLNRVGQLPAISSPDKTSKKMQQLKEQIGEEKIQDALLYQAKQYGKDVEKVISKSFYKKLDDEEKKKELNSIRSQTIKDTLYKFDYKGDI